MHCAVIYDHYKWKAKFKSVNTWKWRDLRVTCRSLLRSVCQVHLMVT